MVRESRPPRWVVTMAERAQSFLDLGGWELYIRMVSETKGKRMAEADLEPAYYTAHVDVCDDVKQDRLGRLTVCHEVAHLFLADMVASQTLVLDMVRGRDRAVARQELEYAMEQAVQRLAQLVLRELEKEDATKPGDNVQVNPEERRPPHQEGAVPEAGLGNRVPNGKVKPGKEGQAAQTAIDREAFMRP